MGCTSPCYLMHFLTISLFVLFKNYNINKKKVESHALPYLPAINEFFEYKFWQ